MKLDLTTAEKHSIAIMLKQDRKLKHQTMKEYILCEEGHELCSFYTYSNLENEKKKVDDEIYDKFVYDKFHRRICYEEAIINLTNLAMKSAYKAFVRYDIEKLDRTRSVIEGLKYDEDDVNIYLWQDVYVNILVGLHDIYFGDSKLDESELEFYISTCDVYDYYAQELLKALIFHHAYIHIPSVKKINHICERIHLEDSKSSFNLLHTCYLSFINEKMLSPYKKIYFLEKFYKKSDNYNRLLEIYGMQLSFISNLERQSTFEFLEKIESFYHIHINQLDPLKKVQFMYNKAVAYMQMNDYISAYKGFEYFLKYSPHNAEGIPSRYLPTAIFMNYICSVNHWECEDYYMIEVDETLYPRQFYNLYKFYLMKKDHNAHELQEFLHRQVLMHADKDDTLINEIIHYELLKLTRITKNRSPLKLLGKL